MSGAVGFAPTRSQTMGALKAETEPLPDAYRKISPGSKAKNALPRIKTFSVGANARRKDKISISSENLAHLHSLHKKSQHESSAKGGAQKVYTDRHLCKKWGKDGSWLITAKIPSDKEDPFSQRSFRILPKGGGTFEGLCASWGVAVFNMKGVKGPRDKSIGQDNFAFARLSNGWEMYSIFDGHGTNGHWPAARAAMTVPYCLQHKDCLTMLDHHKADAALLYAFEKVEEEMEEASRVQDVNLFECGCTALCVLRYPAENKVVVGTLGDTRAVLILPSTHEIVYETRDQKPNSPGEKERLVANGCEIFEEEHEDGTWEIRVYLKGEGYPGLAMSRSLGDCIVKEEGVIAVPECVRWDCSASSGALLFGASDGVWEFMSSEEVVEILMGEIDKGSSHQQAVEKVVETSKSYWSAHEVDYCDDITAMLIPVTGPHAPASVGGPSNDCCDGIKDSCTLL